MRNNTVSKHCDTQEKAGSGLIPVFLINVMVSWLDEQLPNAYTIKISCLLKLFTNIFPSAGACPAD